MPEQASKPATLKDFYARDTATPLADAFESKRAVHPFVGMRPVPQDEVPALWSGLHAAPRKNRAVAYVHVPFCENHCLFCGFYQNAWRGSEGAPYVDAVIAQLEAFARTPARDGPPLQAVYLGGGTPTALAAGDIARLITALRSNLPLAPDCEITLEGRVHSFGLEKARAAFDAGATRVSLGVQSFENAIRRPLGRKAERREVIRCLERLVALDCGAIVVDLIYGLPKQTPDHVASDVALCAEIGLDGFDLYALNLIPGTPLLTAIDKGKMLPAARADLGDFFTAGEEAAQRAGWRQISTTHWQGSLRERNVYNLAVKTGADCLAFGAGAGGFVNGVNYRILSDLAAYAENAGTEACLTMGMMRPSSRAPLHNAIKSGMERGRFDPDLLEAGARKLTAGRVEVMPHLAPLLAQWVRTGLMTRQHRFYPLTRAGRFWQVAMTARLIGWLDQHPDLEDMI